MSNITRRRFVKQLGSGCAAVGGASILTALPERMAGGGSRSQPPNIVLFLTDDHGKRDTGCYGNEVVQTPNIDRLAEEGLRFTRSFAITATCVPARASLYTGLGPHRHGAHVNHGWVQPGLRTLPTFLSQLGYRVLLAGKTHIKPERAFPFEYIDTEGDWTSIIVKEDSDVTRFLRQEAGEDQPFCLVIATNNPHVPWPTDTDEYDPDEVPLHPFHLDTVETRQATANYYADVTRMDQEVGRTLDLLDEQGLTDNTAFIYTSDQGPQLPHAKWELYDYGINVPLIVRWPDAVEAGHVSEAMVSSVDVLPTLIELAGGTPPSDLDGQSFLPVLRQETDQHRDVVYGTHTRDGMMNYYPIRAIRNERYKYIWNLAPERVFTNHITNSNQFRERGGAGLFNSWMEKANRDEEARKRLRFYQQRPEEELYDLKKDPHELHNRADDTALQEVKDRLHAQLQHWMGRQNDEGRTTWQTRFEGREAWRNR